MKYEQVINDFKSGVIDRNKWQVVFDNDGGFWSYIGDDGETLNENLVEQMMDSMEQKYGSPNGFNDLVVLAVAAGINAEWC